MGAEDGPAAKLRVPWACKYSQTAGSWLETHRTREGSWPWPPLAPGDRPQDAGANGWSQLPSKMLPLCPPEGKGTGSRLPQSPRGRVPRWQWGQAERWRWAGGHECLGRHSSSGSKVPAAEGLAGEQGATQGWGAETAPPAGHSQPPHVMGIRVISSEANYSRKTYPGLLGALHHRGVLHHVTGWGFLPRLKISSASWGHEAGCSCSPPPAPLSPLPSLGHHLAKN